MLYLCATPIGNLEDITMRVLRVLKEVDLIAAEDTRQTLKLLNHYEIKTPMTSYHEHNKAQKGKYLLELLQEGKNIALVTDAGTPAISDPGEDLAREAYQAGIGVTSLPGPSAVITAMTLCGFSTRQFTFQGFLPLKNKERQPILEFLQRTTYATVFYEAPHRLEKTLTYFCENLRKDRRIALCKELTKKHESVRIFTLEEAWNEVKENPPRGEYVLVLEGETEENIRQGERAFWEKWTIPEHMDYYLEQDMKKNDAMRQVAKDRNIRKNQVYQALLEEG